MYATKINPETSAKAHGISLPISLKQSVEVCREIRNKKYKVAIKLLESVMTMDAHITYTRFNRGGTGHRKATGPGRYPQKVSGYMLKLLKSAHANANQKGLDVNNLLIKAAVAKQGPKVFRYGRHRGRTAKRTHIEIVLTQLTAKSPVKKEITTAKTIDTKVKAEKVDKK